MAMRMRMHCLRAQSKCMLAKEAGERHCDIVLNTVRVRAPTHSAPCARHLGRVAQYVLRCAGGNYEQKLQTHDQLGNND